ncbi:amidohydrolase, partial [candidate division KSB1 bacterium]|nr:amidohydrolase [candidate division KSB1 bacterium]NIR69797.1 amidohydrolase [candidate division KSB1 bacterium]NIS25787.1 amidohydrolase [candidate division KSB1 bacterium]NIT72661.1 amidohydrolase [candidate division KSB1 bacterium]NIU26476.1 amidohydrolase [candidate division KSB1 bacterium]
PRIDIKIFVNGKIWTNDRPQKEATAMAVQGGCIVAVGDESTVQPFKHSNTQIVDLNGKRVLPGFNDAHVHFMKGGFHLLGVDLRKAQTRDEFRAIVKDYASNLPNGRWITGGNWDHEVWPDKHWPSKELIDDVTPDHPVMVQRLDMHIALANSRALGMAGITTDTPDPFGGTIHRDPKTGVPTGILIDNAADLVYGVIPDPTAEERLQAARAAQQHALSLGVTSLQDINASERDLRTYLNLCEASEFKVRLYVFRPIGLRRQLAEVGVRRAFGNAWMRIGGVKAFTDGSMGARSALFYEPYNDDPATSGLALQSKEDLLKMILEADASGLQIALHAIGDKANTWALDAFEAARKRNGNWERRHRIEHAQVVLPTDLPRFAELGVIASLQPSHCIDDMRWAEGRIGNRTKHSYLVRSFVKHDSQIAFGTDWTVASLNPMEGLYAAVTRESLEGSPAGGWFPDEKIALEQAIEFYTLGSAYAEFADHEKGRLVPGSLADFVVLDRDIFSISPKELPETRVLMTVVGGDVMFEQT